MIPTPETLQRAKEILDDMERLSGEIAALFGTNPPAATPKRRGRPPGKAKSIAKPAAAVPRKHRMSAAGRARIGAAAKARWARFHAERRKQDRK